MTTQNKILKYLLLGVIGILLGFIATCLFISYSSKYNQRVVPFIYIGGDSEPLLFKSYADSLYLPDETVLRMPHGVVDTPELAAEIGSAVLMDIYGKKEMSKEYPFNVVEYQGSWTVFGSLPKGCLGGVGVINISRADGMILLYDHGK